MAKKAKKRRTSGAAKSGLFGFESAAGFSLADFSAPEVEDYVVIELKYDSAFAT